MQQHRRNSTTRSNALIMYVIPIFLWVFCFLPVSEAQINVQSINTIFSSNVGISTSSPNAKLHVRKPLGNGSVISEGGENPYYVNSTDPFLVESEFSNIYSGSTPDGTMANFIIKK